MGHLLHLNNSDYMSFPSQWRKSLTTWLFVQQFVKVNNKENNYWSSALPIICEGNPHGV